MQNLNVSTANIGSYNFVSNFGTLAATITQATTQAMSPFLMENYKNKKDYEARNLIFIWQAGISILFFIGSLWLKEIFILMVTNNEFVDLYPLAIILVMAQLYRPMYAGGIAKLFYLNKTSFLYKVTLTAGVINILLNLFFIPIYGFEFVVYSTYITFLLQGYLFFIYPVFKEVNPIKFYPLFWLTLQLILSATVYLIRDINIPYKIIITGGTILIVSILFFKYKKKII
jgi:O-antigen/teichoic acid export membrane protein